MSSCLIALLPELQEQIFAYCNASDMKNVACSNSTHNELIKEMLWHTITVPWKCMSHKDFLICENKKLMNLKFTRILRFASYSSETDGSAVVKEIMVANYTKVLEFCNAELLHSLLIEDVLVEEPAIKFTCQLLNQLKTFSFLRVALTTDIFRHITKIHDLTALDLQSTCIDDSHILLMCTSVTSLKLLNLTMTKVTDLGLSLLAELKSLEKLVLGSCNISDHGLSDIGMLINLKELDLSYCHITDNGLSALTNLTLLRKLDITCNKVTDNGLSFICSRTSLQKDSSHITDGEIINRLPYLKTLILGCTCITDTGLQYISNNLHFEAINVSFNNITDVGIKHLSTLRSLRLLDIGDTSVTDEGIMYLHSLTNLRELNVSFDHITDIGLFHISKVSSLETIDISGTEVTDFGLEYLSTLRGLKELRCHDSNITDAGLSCIGNMLSIEYLDVSDTKITDCGLAHLILLRLTTLMIDGTEVTDLGLSHISKMMYLAYLDINYTKITNSGVTHLCILTQLKYFGCSGTSVTSDGLGILQSQIKRIDM